jgi:CheY-like chemotaxis protein
MTLARKSAVSFPSRLIYLWDHTSCVMSCTPSAEARPFAVKNGLVVGADPQIETLLLTVLKPGSWIVLCVPDNLAAVAADREKAFDLILTGDKTSGPEDIELLRQIRRVRPHTRLIILTGESTPADVTTSMRESPFSYFSRPFSLNSLAEMIRIATEGPCWDDAIEVVSGRPEFIRILARCDLKTAGVPLCPEIDGRRDSLSRNWTAKQVARQPDRIVK